MNKANQILRDIKLSEVLGTEMNTKTKKVKEFIDDKLKGLVQFESYEYPGDFFYKKGNIILFRLSLKSGYLLCSHKHYWLFFKNDIGLSYSEIQELTISLVGTHLSCKEFTPSSAMFQKWKKVGTHLNCKEFTTV